MEWREMYRITPITQLSREEKVDREEEEKVKEQYDNNTKSESDYTSSVMSLINIISTIPMK